MAHMDMAHIVRGSRNAREALPLQASCRIGSPGLPRGTLVAHLPLLFRRIEDAEIADWVARFGGGE